MSAPLPPAQVSVASKPANGKDESGGLMLKREHFIPVSRYGLRAKLIDRIKRDGDERVWARAFDCLAAWRHNQYRQQLLALLEDYLPFSPDSDEAAGIEFDAASRETAQREFLQGVEQLLVHANYLRLREQDLRRLLIARSPHGLYLEVDLSDFDEVLLYYRGSEVERREERNPWRLYLTKDAYNVHIFQRLFLLLKLKPSEQRIAEIMQERKVERVRAERIVRHRRKHLPIGVTSAHIYVKVFKRIPQVDLEMLFPNTRIAFKPFDKLKLFVTAGGGTAAGVAGTAAKILAATNPYTLAMGLAGFSAVIFRQVMNFFNTRNRYMMVLAQNLYFCSLANNLGALTLIADSAEEEDVKEDMLLYAFLAANPTRRDALQAAKSEIGAFLSADYGVRVSFDAEDALKRLAADGLVREAADGTLTALPPESAQDHLDRLWDRLLDVDTLDQAAKVHAGA